MTGLGQIRALSVNLTLHGCHFFSQPNHLLKFRVSIGHLLLFNSEGVPGLLVIMFINENPRMFRVELLVIQTLG